MRCVNVILSDFDDTLFKRNHGLIDKTVSYLEERNYPIYIVTYRARTQQSFIQDTLAETRLNVIGLAMGGDRYKNPHTKLKMVEDIMTRHNVIEALDDDEAVVLVLRNKGINAHKV